jgi:hypothetical protein
MANLPDVSGLIGATVTEAQAKVYLSQMVAFSNLLSTQVLSAGTGILAYTAYSNLPASPAQNSTAFVTNDPTPAKNGIYYYNGSAWALFTDQWLTFLTLNNYIGAPAGASLIGFQQNGTGKVARTVQSKASESLSVADFGAIGDGTNHTINEWVVSGRFANLAAIQTAYPHATALTDSLDWVTCQAAVNAAGKGGTVLFNATPYNTYVIDRPIKYYNGQCWRGCGGIDLTGLGTQIKLIASATSCAEPINPTVVTYGFNPVGIYFNAQSFAPAGLWLYNTSYAKVDQCSASCSTANGSAFLLDSNVSLQTYFNILSGCRAFATGSGGVGFNFIRGANANQILGGKCGSSFRGAAFSSLSAGNLVMGTDFESNTDCHIYLDATANIFIGVHMEVSPIGYNITANGYGSRRFGTTYATSVTIPVQEAVVGNSSSTHELNATGVANLSNGVLTQVVTPFSSSISVANNLYAQVGTESISYTFFRNTTSTSTNKLITWYKGDGTATISHQMNIATGQWTCGDIVQYSAGGIYNRIMRANIPPTTGTYASGDKVLRSNVNATAVVTSWTCVTAGTSGTWKASSWHVNKDVSANRPTLTSIDIGVMFFDTTLAANGKPIWWTGTVWVDALGASV